MRARGRDGEEIAARFLALCGCTVLQRNVRHADVEIDLLGRAGNCLLVVEVKLRTGAVVAAREGVAWRQEKRLLRAAQAFLAEHAWAEQVRLDVIAVDVDVDGGRMRVEHVRGALPR